MTACRVVLAVVAIAWSTSAGAQVTVDSAATGPTSPLREDRWSIEFSVPRIDYDPGGAAAVLGVWNMVSDQAALGASFGIHVRSSSGEETTGDSITLEDESMFVGFSFAPGVRRYFETRGDVSAYVDLAVPLAVGGSSNRYWYESSSWSASVGVTGGLGLTWFITDELSLAGGFGAGFRFTHGESESSDPDRERSENTASFDVRSGELRMALWF